MLIFSLIYDITLTLMNAQDCVLSGLLINSAFAKMTAPTYACIHRAFEVNFFFYSWPSSIRLQMQCSQQNGLIIQFNPTPSRWSGHERKGASTFSFVHQSLSLSKRKQCSFYVASNVIISGDNHTLSICVNIVATHSLSWERMGLAFDHW